MIKKTPQNSLRALQKLDRSILLRETGAPEFIRWSIILCSGVIVLFVLWASIIQVDEVSKAKGQLKPSLPVHPIQHFFGGTIAQVHVKDGDHVKQDDLLFTLDMAELNSQMDETRIQCAIIEGRKNRLRAYIYGEPEQNLAVTSTPPQMQTPLNDQNGLTPSLSKKISPIPDPETLHKELAQQQDSIIKQVQESLQSQRKVSDHQIQQLLAENETSRLNKINLEQQLQLIELEMQEHESKSPEGIQLLEQEKDALKEEMDIREDLVDQGLNSNIKFLALQRQFYQIQKDIMEKKLTYSEKSSLFKRQIQQLKAQIDTIPQDIKKRLARIAEVKEQQTLLESQSREQMLAELDKIIEDENSQRERLNRLDKRIHSSYVKATVDGIVQHVKQAGPGAVISPGELILNIVPQNATLIAEVHLEDKDVGHIQVNQEVRLKLTSFDFSRYGSLPGRVTMIDATNTLDPSGRPYFLARVEILSVHPGGDRHELFVKAGMSLDADIITGQKSIMEYLLKPIYASTREALQER
jgi:membrane fusion protein, adhesin transport system